MTENIVSHEFEMMGFKFKVSMKPDGDFYEVTSLVRDLDGWRRSRVDFYLLRSDLMAVVHAEWRVQDLLAKRTLKEVFRGYNENEHLIRTPPTKEERND